MGILQFNNSDKKHAFSTEHDVSITMFVSIAFSVLAAAFIAAFAVFLIAGGAPALKREGADFVAHADWHYRVLRFGAGSMVYGSAVVAIIAILFSVPLGIGSAVLTSEYLQRPLRTILKMTVEFLAGIPSVVYGLLGVLYLRPFIFELMSPFHPESGDNLFTAGLLVGIMILPTIMSLTDNAFRSVPKEDRESARSLGLTCRETFFHAVFPKALPGVVAAVFLGLGRALGETIAVYLVVGRADNRLPDTWHSFEVWLQAGQTLTSKLGGSEINIAYGNPQHWSAMLALGLVLFVAVVICVFASETLILTAKKYRL